MDLDAARSALGPTRFGDLRWVAETGSTNADLLDAARAGAGEQVLVADHQTAGKGRLDRTWEEAPGSSLLMSVLVREPFPAAGVHLLPTAVALAAADAVTELTGYVPGLKWPNDIVAPGAGADGGDRKLGGLLSEYQGGEQAGVVVGLGLNLAWEGRVPEGLEEIATALDLVGAAVDRWDLVTVLLSRLHHLADLEEQAACERLRDRFRKRCTTLGRPVRVTLTEGSVEGVATDVTVAGALVVTDDDGDETEVTVGDVVHLRPRP